MDRWLRSTGCVLLLALAGLASAGCEPSRSTEDDGLSTVTVLLGGSHREVNVFVNNPAMHLLFMPLFWWDRDGNVEGRLVRDWEYSEDGRTWTYHLRTDVRWHDGIPVTAEDVKFSFDLYTHPDVLTFAPGSRNVTVLDDSTVTIEYARGSTTERVKNTEFLPLNDWQVVLPKHVLEDLDPAGSWDWEFWTQPVGDGPYRWVRYVPETMIELEANPDFHLGKPAIDRVILKLGGGNAWIELQAGNIDIAGFPTVGPDLYDLISGDDDIDVYWSNNAGSFLGLFLNHTHPALADARVRRALNHALDRVALKRIRNVPDDVPLYDVPMTKAQFARGEFPEPLGHDPDLARSLLAQAGWVDGDGDGIREKNGTRLTLTCLCDPGLELVQAQLREVGVDLQLIPMAPQAARERFRAGEYDLYGIDAMGSRFRAILGDSLAGLPNIGYSNARLTQLARQLGITLIPERRDSLLREIWPIWQADAPVLVLTPQVFYTAAHRRVKGMESPNRVFAVSHMDELWLEDTAVASERGGR